ncbi:MAG: hypothetical protein WD992_00065 [Candidatus Levyibacteriota bacterium]
MKTIIKLLNKFWPVLAIISIEIVLFLTNYKSGAYLMGWDNLMPEFNIGLNLKRSIFGVWQDYRGLGLPDGMAHTANLLHTIYIFLLSLVLPENLLRYTFITLTHLLGGIGIFILLKYLFKNKKLAFSGALFYLFNLGVIQMFYAPLEVFAVHFTALPWISLFTLRAFENPNKKNLFFLFTSALLTSPQGFVPTVFIAFLILFSSIVISNLIRTRKIKTAFIICIVVFTANAFWILPYAYNSIPNSAIIRNTRINEFSSEEIFYRNKARGNIPDVLTLKGFMIDTIEYDSQANTNFYFLSTWRNLSQSLIFNILSWIIALIMILGLFISLKRKENVVFPFAISLTLAFLLLANNTFILGGLNDLLRTMFPVLAEAFRFPFTKLIILFAFCYSIFLTRGLIFIGEKLKKNDLIVFFPSLVIIFLISYPVFQGNFYPSLLRLQFPTQYKEAFSYFNKADDNGRIAMLPAQTFWNWQYWKWGDRGSGFIWFGIDRPILLRPFDPWSLYNEQFYNEFSYSIDSRDAALFDKVLTKYDVSYILLDKGIQNSTNGNAINYDSLEEFLTSSGLASKDKQVGDLIIYKIANAASPVYSLDSSEVARISGTFNFNSKDHFYSDLGNYVPTTDNPDALYLLPSLFSSKLQKDLEFEATQDEKTITFSPKNIPYLNLPLNSALEIPSLFNNDFLVPVNIRVENSKIYFTPNYPKIFINERGVVLREDPIIISPSSVVNPKIVEFTDITHVLNIPQDNQSFLLNKQVNVIKLSDGENEEIIYLDTADLTETSYFVPLTETRIEDIKIVVDKIKSPLSSPNLLEDKKYEISEKKDRLSLFPGDIMLQSTHDNGGIRLSARGNSSIELASYLENLFHQTSYILTVEAEYKFGLPVTFYVDNPFENRPELETRLSKDGSPNVIFVPKTEDFFKGYGFHFQVKSVGKEKSESIIEKISLYPIPQSTLENLRIFSNPNKISPSGINKNSVVSTKILSYLYVSDKPRDGSYLILSQSYDSGWKAYEVKDINFATKALPFVFGKEIKNHVKVNNWQNGWSGISGDKVIIVYLPQYLEYFGFFLLIGTFGYLLFRRLKS